MVCRTLSNSLGSRLIGTRTSRTRKIRCDGAKPICHNCGRRPTGGSDCNYDSIPKRRGPDKTPGARQRIARELRNEIEGGAPRRRRRTRDIPAADATKSTRASHNFPATLPVDEPPGLVPAIQLSTTRPIASFSSAPGFSLGEGSNYQLLPTVSSTANSNGSYSNRPSSSSSASYQNASFVTSQNYPSSSYSPCRCHGLTNCSHLESVRDTIDPSTPVSVVSFKQSDKYPS